ncbi:MAG TPA: phage major capsid protein [Verrucomicrobiae bacterium]|nr:phage major capsid protein [Verrucomicrobiae bacterium]
MKRSEFHFGIVTRSLDAARGTCTAIVSTPTVDSDNESVVPRGCDLSRFNRNAPLVDSHNYSSVSNQIGKVTDVRISDKRVECDLQFAIDVPENNLARLAFGMVKAGYLKGCSIGFQPMEYISPSDGKLYQQTLAELGLKNQQPSRIYTAWTFCELSLCVLGSNPDALLQTAKSIGMSSRDLAPFQIKTRSSITTPSPSTPLSEMKATKDLLASLGSKQKFDDLSPATRREFQNVETTRRNGNERDIQGAVLRAQRSLGMERRHSLRDPIAKLLREDRDAALLVDGLVRYLCSSRMHPSQSDMVKEFVTKSTTFGTNLASSIFPMPVSPDILWDTVLQYGAFRDFVLPMLGQQTQYAEGTQVPDAWFMTPTTGMGTAIPTDVSLAGTSLSKKANTIATLLPVSEEWLQDATINVAALFLRMFTQGIAKRIDYGCFMANGTDDTANGAQTGIFQNNTVVTVNAAAGNVALAQLQREDFLLAVSAVNPAVLQRECRWYIHPGFIPTLLTLREAKETKFLLKTPEETQSGEWVLVGFPVTWSPQNPSTDGANQQIAAFGDPSCYVMGLREEFELMSSGLGPSFSSNVRNVRALARGRGDMRDAAGFAILNTAKA